MDCEHDGLARRGRMGFTHVHPDDVPDGYMSVWMQQLYEVAVHEIGHVLGVGTISGRDVWPPPARVVNCVNNSCEHRSRYECRYQTWDGERRTTVFRGLRTWSSAVTDGRRDYGPAIRAYVEAGGPIDDMLPVGQDTGHLHSSMAKGAIMAPGAPWGSKLTTITLGILASIGYDVDMTVGTASRVTGGERSLCAENIAQDDQWDPTKPWGLVRNW